MTAGARRLHGQIEGDTLPVLLQTVGSLGRSCTMLISVEGMPVGRIVFLGGQLVHASHGAVAGEAAIPGLLSLRSGTFDVYDGEDRSVRSIDRPLMDILMKAAVSLDEGAPVLDAPALSGARKDDPHLRPPSDAVPVLRTALLGTALPVDARPVLEAADSWRSVADIATLTGRPLEDVNRVLTAYYRAGHLSYDPALMPPAFWTATQRATTQVAGPASLTLLRRAAAELRLKEGRVPRQDALRFHDRVAQGLRPEKRPALIAGLAAVQRDHALS